MFTITYKSDPDEQWSWDRYSDDVSPKEVKRHIDPEHGYSMNYFLKHCGIRMLNGEEYRAAYSLARKAAEDSGLRQDVLRCLDMMKIPGQDKVQPAGDPASVRYDLASTLWAVFIAMSSDCGSFESVGAKLSADSDFTAAINVLLPDSLPPHQDHSPVDMAFVMAAWDEACRNQDFPTSSDQAGFWFKAVPEASVSQDRLGYKADYGFLRGQALTSDRAFMDISVGDILYTQAINPLNINKSALFWKALIYNISDRSLSDLIFVAAEEQDEQSYKRLSSHFGSISGNIFVTEAFPHSGHLFKGILSSGVELLIAAGSTDTGNDECDDDDDDDYYDFMYDLDNGEFKSVDFCSPLVVTKTEQIFNSKDLEKCKSHRSFVSEAYSHGGNMEKVTVEAVSLSELQSLGKKNKKLFPDELKDELYPFEGLKTLVKKTIYSQPAGKRVTKKALESFNRNPENASTVYYVCTVENDEHGFKQIIAALNEQWLCQKAAKVAGKTYNINFLARCKSEKKPLLLDFARESTRMLDLYRIRCNEALGSKDEVTKSTVYRLISRHNKDLLACLKLYMSTILSSSDSGKV